MSIPSRAEAAQILRALDPPDWLLSHSAVVADVAAFLAAAIELRGHAINVGLVEAAALLHDVDKALPAGHALKQLRHGDAGAAWLRERGHGELAGSVANHPVTRLSDERHYFAWSSGATVEERIVAYADKRAQQELVALEERFVEWNERHGDTPEMKVALERARALEADVCAAAGVEPEEVRRHAWAAAALDSTA